MGVMGRPTRPLPVPGPWGIPGPYQVYAGTRLRTTLNIFVSTLIPSEIRVWINLETNYSTIYTLYK